MHTAGPWDVRVRKVGNNPYSLSYEINIGATSLVEAEANARLMRHAPALLEACKEVEEWWLREGKNEFLGAPHCIFAVREIVAKAAGR